jgi:hypothetical protein
MTDFNPSLSNQSTVHTYEDTVGHHLYVQWTAVQLYDYRPNGSFPANVVDRAVSFTFQLVLSHSGDIQFHYVHVPFDPATSPTYPVSGNGVVNATGPGYASYTAYALETADFGGVTGRMNPVTIAYPDLRQLVTPGPPPASGALIGTEAANANGGLPLSIVYRARETCVPAAHSTGLVSEVTNCTTCINTTSSLLSPTAPDYLSCGFCMFCKCTHRVRTPLTITLGAGD